MDEKEETRNFVNTPLDSDLLERLDEMVGEDESTRAQFIRLLIRREWERREVKKAKTQPKIKPVAA